MTVLAGAVLIASTLGGVQAAPPQTCPAEIVAAPWPAAEACAVAWCESRWDPDAYNPAGPYRGYFQVAAMHVAEPLRLYEPAFNVAAALRLWQASGWQPWGCKP